MCKTSTQQSKNIKKRKYMMSCSGMRFLVAQNNFYMTKKIMYASVNWQKREINNINRFLKVRVMGYELNMNHQIVYEIVTHDFSIQEICAKMV